MNADCVQYERTISFNIPKLNCYQLTKLNKNMCVSLKPLYCVLVNYVLPSVCCVVLKRVTVN